MNFCDRLFVFGNFKTQLHGFVELSSFHADIRYHKLKYIGGLNSKVLSEARGMANSKIDQLYYVHRKAIIDL